MNLYTPGNPLLFQTSWHEFINYFKSIQHPDPRHILRMSIT